MGLTADQILQKYSKLEDITIGIIQNETQEKQNFLKWREYYSAFKRNLEDIVLSEISQTQKDKYCMIHLDEVVKFIETESRCWFPGTEQ